MIFDNSHVRRRDRLMTQERAVELLQSAEYGVLSMSTPDGEPYGVPVNFVWDGNNTLYIHCAPEGRKLRILEANSRVSFCIVGNVHLLPGRFTTTYESVVVEGNARLLESDEAKIGALRLLVRKLAPQYASRGDKYIMGSLHRVNIIAVDADKFSGKNKIVNPQK